MLDIDFDEAGEHVYLLIRKCGMNTLDVVEQLQREFGCSSVDTGYCGLKDKQAITEQWLSFRSNQKPDLSRLLLPSTQVGRGSNAIDGMISGEFRVLRQVRHSRKLRRGAHSGNAFDIVIRNVSTTDRSLLSEAQQTLQQRLQEIKRRGFANYFGPQRFGYQGQNIRHARQMFGNPKRRITRTKRGLLLSAARSHLFNAVCAERVRANTWLEPLDGEPMLLDGSNSFFIHANSNTETQARCDALDVHTSGPLPGAGEALSKADCHEFEFNVLSGFTDFISGLQQAGLTQHRRALRACVKALDAQWLAPDTLSVSLQLDSGVFATTFLSEFVDLSLTSER